MQIEIISKRSQDKGINLIIPDINVFLTMDSIAPTLLAPRNSINVKSILLNRLPNTIGSTQARRETVAGWPQNFIIRMQNRW